MAQCAEHDHKPRLYSSHTHTAQATKAMPWSASNTSINMNRSQAPQLRSSWSEGRLKVKQIVRSWHSAGMLLEPPAAPLRSTTRPMPASADSSRRRKSTGQRDDRKYYASSPVPVRLKSSLDFELAIWQRAATKKKQLVKLAADAKICDKHLARNAGARRANEQCCNGMVLPSDATQPAVFLQWALAFVCASVLSLFAVWS
jgi:hypothetical protein